MSQPVKNLDNHKAIRKLIDFKGYDQTPCKKVLGDETSVGIIANFWINHADLIELIATNELLAYLTGEEKYSSEQNKAFQEGIAKIGLFMEKCAQEWDEQQGNIPADSSDA